jgi:hypothetical protein
MTAAKLAKQTARAKKNKLDKKNLAFGWGSSLKP